MLKKLECSPLTAVKWKRSANAHNPVGLIAIREMQHLARISVHCYYCEETRTAANALRHTRLII